MARNRTIQFLDFYKGGIIIGGITGAVAAWYVLSQGQDLSTIVEAGKGLLDTALSRTAPVEVAKYKVYSVFITTGAIIGLLSDMFITRFLPKRRRR